MPIGRAFRRAVEQVLLATSAWQDWTPTVYQAANIASTVTEAKYCIVGKVCHIYASILIDAVGTTGNLIAITGVPAAASPALNTLVSSLGNFMYIGAAYHVGSVQRNSASSFKFYCEAATGAMGVDPAFAVAATDSIAFSATYRVA